MKKFFAKVKDVLEGKRGEGYIDTAVKMIIAVVIGALLLGGLYALFNGVIIPRQFRGSWCNGSVTLLDTRTVREYQRGHIEGFYNIPVDELRDRLDEVDPTKPVYVICQSGLRSYISCRILEGNGYTAYNFAGGFRFYQAVMNDKALIKRATACGMDN